MKLISWNVNGIRAWYKKGALDEILRQNPDILCLQEVFDEQSASSLSEQLKKAYPYQLYDIGPKKIGLSSGLMVLSKHPIRNPVFYSHPVACGADRFANKGVVLMEVDISASQTVVIANTHLNAGFLTGDPEAEEIRHTQLTYVGDCIEEYKKEKAPQGLFIAGDYNMYFVEDRKYGYSYSVPGSRIGPSEEYKSNIDFFKKYEFFEPLFHLRGDDRKKLYDIPTSFIPNGDESPCPPFQLDHIAVDPSYAQWKGEVMIHPQEQGVWLSDHLLVSGKYSWIKKNTSSSF